MNALPRIQVEYGENIGVELLFALPDLKSNLVSYLDADVAIGAGSLTANGTKFSVGEYIIIGRPGSEKSELVRIHASTAPTATTITLVGTTTFAHLRGDRITHIPYNQIVPERSTNGGTSYSALSAIDIRVDALQTFLARTSDASTDYYKYRFYNSTTTLYSAYSDPVIASGLGDDTVGSVKRRALDALGEKVGGLITDTFLNDSIMEARRLADQNPAVLRWGFRTQFDATLAQVYAGQWRIAAPTDLRDRNSPKNILSLRFAGDNQPIVYQDRAQFNQNYLNTVHTTVATAALSGASSLILTSTANLDDTGVISIAGEDADDDIIEVDYTANNRTTNTLTVTAADVTRNISAGTDAWQRATFGSPTNYSIHAGYIYFDVPIENAQQGRSITGDYYKAIPTIDSDADTFDEPFYDLYVSYLKWKIKYKKANGKIDRDTDSDWKDWLSGLATLISQEFPAQPVNFVPNYDY